MKSHFSKLCFFAVILFTFSITIPIIAEDAETSNKEKQKSEVPMDTTSLVIMGIFACALIGAIGYSYKWIRDQSHVDNMQFDQFANQTLADYSNVNLHATEEILDTQSEQTNTQTNQPQEQQNESSLKTKLQAANLLDQQIGKITIEGIGQVPLIQLKDGKTAMLFDQMPDGKILRQQLRRCELLFVSINETDAIVIESMGEYISKKIML